MRGKRAIWLLWVTLAVLSTSVALTSLAQDVVDPYIGIPNGGTWEGMAYFGTEAEQLAAPITFEMDAAGMVSGTIRFTFRYEGMPDNLVQLIDAHGCVTTFAALTPQTSPVSGYFIDAGRAVGMFSANACYLEGYGDLNFASPISGVWYAEQGGSAALVFAVQPAEGATEVLEATATNAPEATSAPVTEVASADGDATGGDYDPELMAFGVEVFLEECSECHGVYGEGGQGVADLTDRKVTRMSDTKLLEIINLGVEGTEMAPWGVILSEEEKQAIILLIRHPEVLREQ